MALEYSNQMGPKIQIALARMQLQEERVRNVTHLLQDARDGIASIQTNRAECIDRIKQNSKHSKPSIQRSVISWICFSRIRRHR